MTMHAEDLTGDMNRLLCTARAKRAQWIRGVIETSSVAQSPHVRWCRNFRN